MKIIPSSSVAIPKVYRHFAMATLSVTLLMAIMADGERREAMAEEVGKVEQLSRSGPAKPQGAQVIDTSKTERKESEGSFGPDRDSSFGAPMTGGGGGGSSGGSRSSRGGSSASGMLATLPPQQVPASYAPYGITDKQLAKMTPEQRAAFFAQLKAAMQGTSPAARQAQIARLEAMSENGSSNSDD